MAILVSTIVTLFCLLICICFVNNDPINVLNRNIKKLTKYLQLEICTIEYAETYPKFSTAKKNLLNKHKLISVTICNMVNLYYIDDKITKFYNEQKNKLDNISIYIQNRLNELVEKEDFYLSQKGISVFDELNTILNNQISEFIIGNATFYTKLKFSKNKSIISNEKLNKKYKLKKVVIYLLSLIISIGVSIIANLLTKKIGF